MDRFLAMIILLSTLVVSLKKSTMCENRVSELVHSHIYHILLFPSFSIYVRTYMTEPAPMRISTVCSGTRYLFLFVIADIFSVSVHGL